MINVSVTDKSFAGAGTVIADVSFSVSAGEFIAFVGPSGAGKSTLLNLISGLDSDFTGQITGQGKCPEDRRIGMMFQEPRLMPWLSVIENVMLVVPSTEESRSRAEKLLDLVGLATFAHKYPGQLSGGMKKRVALARAFMPKPDVLLMDEPFASLDAPAAEDLRRKLLMLRQEQHVTIIYVTHNLNEAISLADRILFFSSAPMQLILEQSIDIERPRSISDERVAACHEQLLQRQPDLLKGLSDSIPIDYRPLGKFA